MSDSDHYVVPKNAIVLRSGKYLDYDNPLPEVINIIDMTWSLSHICRYIGHVSRFYSVAQHSVYVSQLCLPEHAFEGLMHDTAEPYTGDISSPLKRLLEPQIGRLENKLERIIAAKWHLTYPWPQDVKHADLMMLNTERRDLFPFCNPNDIWGTEFAGTANFTIEPWSPEEAEARFLAEFVRLWEIRKKIVDNPQTV